jgi:hypothetical protein
MLFVVSKQYGFFSPKKKSAYIFMLFVVSKQYGFFSPKKKCKNKYVRLNFSYFFGDV